MDMQTIAKIKIYSTGTYLPQETVKSDDLFAEFNSEKNYDIPTDWMSKKVGIYERRMGRADAVPSDHAIPAAQQALDRCPEIDPDLINLVIFCGIERDQPEPATAHKIQQALGLKSKHTFDLANACYGFMEAMEVASYYIKGGATEYALIVTGEISTQVARQALKNLQGGMDKADAKNIIGALTVGDAGGAVILGKSFGYDAPGFDIFNTTVDSAHIDKCVYRHNAQGKFEGQMLMGPISNLIVRKHGSLISDTMEKLGWAMPDWVISHQMGAPPFEKIRRLSGVEDKKMIKTFPLLGNITSATFAMNFDRLSNNDKIARGDKVFGCFAGSGLAIGQLGYTL